MNKFEKREQKNKIYVYKQTFIINSCIELNKKQTKNIYEYATQISLIPIIK